MLYKEVEELYHAPDGIQSEQFSFSIHRQTYTDTNIYTVLIAVTSTFDVFEEISQDVMNLLICENYVLRRVIVQMHIC